MNSTIREFVRFELTTYHLNKANLANSNHHSLLSGRQLIWLSLVVQSIDNALTSLPEDVQQYVHLRYFRKNYWSIAGLALNLNVSERTIRNWDILVLKTVAMNIGLINPTYKIAESLPF